MKAASTTAKPARPDRDHPGGTQTLHRAASIVRLVAARNRPGMRLTDVVKFSGLQRPTAHRILKGLIAEGLLTQDPESRLYSLGPLVFELGLAAAPQFNLSDICRPSLQRIAEKTGDTVFLSVRSGHDSVCIDRKEGSFPIKTFTLEIGMRRPLGVGIGSVAILAALPDEDIRHIISSNAPRLPEYGLTSNSLLAQVKKAQKLGYAVRETPSLAGVRSIGQALHNRGGVPFAALSVSAISSRMNEKRVAELAALLRNETRSIEKQLSAGAEPR